MASLWQNIWSKKLFRRIYNTIIFLEMKMENLIEICLEHVSCSVLSTKYITHSHAQTLTFSFTNHSNKKQHPLWHLSYIIPASTNFFQISSHIYYLLINSFKLHATEIKSPLSVVFHVSRHNILSFIFYFLLRSNNILCGQ